jgi:hypothetical protein
MAILSSLLTVVKVLKSGQKNPMIVVSFGSVLLIARFEAYSVVKKRLLGV